MSTDIVPLAETLQLAEILARSRFFEDSSEAAKAVVKILAGRELGIGPIASMTGIHIVKGKPTLGAGIIAATIKRSGKYNYRIRQLDETACRIEFFERVGDKWESIGISSFTIADAKRAGTQNLERYARNMLFARCISNGARWYTPDIFGGPIYTPEELGTPIAGNDEIVESTARTINTETGEIADTSAPATQIAPEITADNPADWDDLVGHVQQTAEEIRTRIMAGADDAPWKIEPADEQTVKRVNLAFLTAFPDANMRRPIREFILHRDAHDGYTRGEAARLLSWLAIRKDGERWRCSEQAIQDGNVIIAWLRSNQAESQPEAKTVSA